MISIKELVLNKHYQLLIYEIRRDNSMPSFVDKIVKILKERNYNIAAKDLKMIDGYLSPLAGHRHTLVESD